MGEIVAILAVTFIFGPALIIPIMAMVQKHRREMLMLELERGKHSNAELLKQIEALRQEIAELRRTATEHSLSLQANLENLQERVRQLEQTEENQTLRTYGL